MNVASVANVTNPNVAISQLGIGTDIGNIFTLATFPLQYPSQKLPEKRKRRIGDDNIRLVPQFLHFLASEIPVTFKILPLQIFNVYLPVVVRVVIENEYLATYLRLLLVELWTFLLEQ